MKDGNIHIIGDVFLAEFAPVMPSAAGEKPAFEVQRLAENQSLGPRRFWTSAGGAARIASLLAPHVDRLILSAPLGEASPLADLLAARHTKTGASIKLNSLHQGAIARVLRAYTRVSDETEIEAWKLAFRLEFPQTTVSSARRLRLDPAEVFLLADYGKGAIAAGVLKEVLRQKPNQLILFAANRNAKVYRQLAGSAANVVVLCTDSSALRWTSIPNPPRTFPFDDPSNYLPLLARVLVQLRKVFPRVNYFVVICEPDSRRCFSFAKDPSTDLWNVYLCEGFQGDETSTSNRVPGSASAFLAAFTRRLLQDGPDKLFTSVVEATRTGIDCVTDLLKKGIGFDGDHFGRPEEIEDQFLPKATSSISRPLTTFPRNVASVVSSTQMAEGLLGYAQLYGELPKTDETLPGYYLPASQQGDVSAVVNTINSYITRTNQKRPFNVLLSALPGSGKSHFVHCLAGKLSDMTRRSLSRDELHPLLEFNLSSIGNASQFEEQLLDIYQDVRDERAAGRMPIVVLDEFDSLLTTSGKGATSEMLVIFSKMLAPLWDGVFAFAKRTRRLGGFVLIMVVSDQRFFESLAEGKGRDFESRIDIQFNLREPTDDEKLEAQVRVALPMLRKHFGDTVSHVELAVLDAIGGATFPRKNRGIDQLFLLSTRPSGSTFRVEHLAPAILIDNRIAQGLNLKASTKRFGRSVVRCI